MTTTYETPENFYITDMAKDILYVAGINIKKEGLKEEAIDKVFLVPEYRELVKAAFNDASVRQTLRNV